jgi:hypothetical protein
MKVRAPDNIAMQVGADRIIFEEESVLIFAAQEIRDWQVREFCRNPIYFRERKYYLRTKRKAEAPFAYCYELVPWPENLHQESIQSFTYSEGVVAQREYDSAVEKKRECLWYVLLPLYPFLGLCWSGFKERVLSPIGFEPVAITSASTMLTFCFVFLDSILFLYLGGGILDQIKFKRLVPGVAHNGWSSLLDLLLILVCLADCLVRFGQLMWHEDVPDGFLEWIFPKRGKSSS